MLTEGQSYGFPSVAVNITHQTNNLSAFLSTKSRQAHADMPWDGKKNTGRKR